VHPADTAEAAQQAPLHPNQVILSNVNRPFLWRRKTLVNHQVK
jgi:hypothetical protein